MSYIGHNSDGDNKKRRENNSDEPDSNIGRVVGASTTEGLLIRLNDNVSPEDLKIGIPIVCEGEKYDFFSIINDIVLSSTDQGLVDRIAGFREAAVNKSGNATVSSFEAFEYPYRLNILLVHKR